jgi:hypothetical protein
MADDAQGSLVHRSQVLALAAPLHPPFAG